MLGEVDVFSLHLSWPSLSSSELFVYSFYSHERTESSRFRERHDHCFDELRGFPARDARPLSHSTQVTPCPSY